MCLLGHSGFCIKNRWQGSISRTRDISQQATAKIQERGEADLDLVLGSRRNGYVWVGHVWFLLKVDLAGFWTGWSFVEDVCEKKSIFHNSCHTTKSKSQDCRMWCPKQGGKLSNILEVWVISVGNWPQGLECNRTYRALSVPAGMIEAVHPSEPVLPCRKSQGLFPKEDRKHLRINGVNKYRSYQNPQNTEQALRSLKT